MLRYPIVLERDDNDTLLVSFPDFPEAHTFGEDEADALVRAKDALMTVLEARIRDRESIPSLHGNINVLPCRRSL
jgi:antitoxin HicB